MTITAPSAVVGTPPSFERAISRMRAATTSKAVNAHKPINARTLMTLIIVKPVVFIPPVRLSRAETKVIHIPTSIRMLGIKPMIFQTVKVLWSEPR